MTLLPLFIWPPRTSRDAGRSEDGTATVAATDIRLGIFEGYAERHLVIGVNHEAVAGNAAPNQAQLVIHVYILRIEDITGQRGDASPVRSHQAPGLPSQKFELTFGHIHPVEPQAEHIRVAGHGQAAVGGISDLTQEVRLPIAQHFHPFDHGVDARADARVLDAEPRFGQASGLRIPVRDAPEVGADADSGVSRPADTSHIHESDRRDISVADLELQGRLVGVGRLGARQPPPRKTGNRPALEQAWEAPFRWCWLPGRCSGE